MEFVGLVEYLEGEVKVEVLLAVDHQNDAFEEETLGLGFDWESDGVGFEKGRVHNSKAVVRWVVSEGIHGGINDNGGRTNNKD